MTDVTKIVSHVINTPGDTESVLVNYTDGTQIKFSLKEYHHHSNDDLSLGFSFPCF